MELASKILSDITVYMKYAKFLEDENRRENWEEIVTRNKNMHIKKYPHIEDEIEAAYSYVYDKKVLPSMRGLQFSGKPIEIAPSRMYNCGYGPIDDIRMFSEAMFLLLGGTGIGYSVQKHHIDKLPLIRRPNPNRTRRFLVADSIEGWADAVKALINSYFRETSKLRFDFSDIRPKGARLVTSGGKAPGPQPLRECLVKLEGILSSKENGDKLSTLEAHDMMCHIADAVLAGGIRRAALISLFSADDEEMLSAKSGNWWETNPQRGRANNSVVLMRHRIKKEFFLSLWDRVRASGAGEPGFLFTNDKDYGVNPCCFVGDTLIETDQGPRSIESIVSEINEGGTCFVKTMNESTREIELNTVKVGLLSRKDAIVVKLTVEENGIFYSVTCTPDHQFFTNNRGWIECKDLTHDDDIVIYNSLV